MAEAIVSTVVESLGKLVIDQTIAFVTSFREVHEQFERLLKEFKTIQGFLHTADSNHNQDPGIRIWVSDVREIAYDVDDVIDTFLRKVPYKEDGESSFMRYARKPKKILNSYKIGKEMETIFSKLKDISKRQKRYAGITIQQTMPSTSSNTNNMLLRRVYSHTKDDATVGLEDHTKTLVSELLKEEDRLCVVSIYGMGGLGKTTIAKEVYNHPNIKNHFHCYAWTSISQQMSTREVLKEILRKVSTLTSKDMGEMNEVELVGKLNGILDGKRYLIVLDDMWNTKDWDILKPAFPNNQGSKIMLTTRKLEVARHADPWSCHLEPRFLTDEEAWELLCRKALPPPYVMSSTLPLSSDLEECGRMMVKKCGGLPLAIIVLGGILQSKRSLGEWENVSKKIGTSADKDDRVLSILSLSYNELPYHLKPLFLYLGLFPEDSNIPVKKLVCMWMAERLITEQEGETIEELGRQCLDELIHRCMVQIGEKRLGEERAKTCRLHDKMRDLCIEIGKKENFFKVMSHQNNDPSSSSSSSSSVFLKLRRCAIHVEEKGKQYIFPKHLTPCLRTAIFIPKDLSTEYCPNIVYKHFKSLKVLEFQGELKPEKELCGVVKKLSNLRYLSVTGDRYSRLTFEFGNFIGNFVCLETLDLRNFNIDKSICKVTSNVMPQLRHFYGYRIQLSEINKMRRLQTLYYARAGPWILDLVKLTNLEKLGIWELDEKTIRLFTNVIVGGGGLDKLRSLYLHTEIEFPSDLLEYLSGKIHLMKLRLFGKFKNGKLPSLFPSNLIKLNLGFTNFSEDPMPTLEKLQHLLFLRLYKSYLGKEMVCSAKGFPKLQNLRIRYSNQLEEWTVEEGAMPCLTKCLIRNCEELKMVPQGFKFLTMLQELTIIHMPKSFEQRVKEGGEDWPTVQHIPSIIISS
ncbi:hypothetical protein AQUCO_05500125v1 [Aquilegia coerulea]|uniref:Uncharacterized protein n=1 Tax=Aquilegia coerulea TaxID=218851 RepID=A0A2G5CH31_AQUCA|nr:hypothetical protein AQUCO_05500125v1 [Aquilegia coerulea]PIA30593.1 hypothetical protein AQUCO_05500125v1 [Aquilegia coerulea]PIA30594.1 hypothetical protein AQUCO_05500125v1 [Aquilegia coerulea]